MSERLSWDQYFMKIAEQVSERSTCPRAKVGAVIVHDRNILATGYNGAPSGLSHCTEVGCLIYETKTPDGGVEQNCFRIIHAEINAIAQAAKNGVSIKGADIYVTHSPCFQCLKVLVNTGLVHIYFKQPYKLHTLQDILEHTAVEISQI